MSTFLVNACGKGTITAHFMHGQHNVGFNAVKELKADDKISGQFRRLQAVYCTTIITKNKTHGTPGKKGSCLLPSEFSGGVTWSSILAMEIPAIL